MKNQDSIQFGVFPKMLIAMLLMAVIPLGTTWLVNYQATTARISEHVDQQLDRIAEGLQGFVDTWVDMNLRMLHQNAELPGMQSMEASRQNPLLRLVTEEYDWNYLAFTVAPNGQNVGRSDGKKTKFYGDRGYVQQVLSGGVRGQQVLIGKTSGKPAFVLSVPIRRETQTIKGLWAIAMTIADISDRITNARLGETGRAFLVDEAGKVIAHQNQAFTLERKDLSGHPAVIAATTETAGTLNFVDEDGKRRVAAYRKTRHGWTLVAEQDHREAFGAIVEANRNAWRVSRIPI